MEKLTYSIFMGAQAQLLSTYDVVITELLQLSETLNDSFRWADVVYHAD